MASPLKTGGPPPQGRPTQGLETAAYDRYPRRALFNLAGVLKHASLVSYMVSVHVVRWLVVDDRFDESVFGGVHCLAPGICGHFDFVYVPVDFKHRAGYGCAFINFLTADRGVYFCTRFLQYARRAFQDANVVIFDSTRQHRALDVFIKRDMNSPVIFDAVPAQYKPLCVMLCPEMTILCCSCEKDNDWLFTSVL